MTQEYGPWIDSNAPWYIRLFCRVIGHDIDEGPRAQICHRCFAFRRKLP